jgi:SAM-dependent methyltransferase
MTGSAPFAADWLDLREPVDHRSRAAGLDQRLMDWLEARPPQPGPRHVLDLGSGTGSNLRYLAPRLPGPQHWTLIDNDRQLLDRARASWSETDRLRLTTRCLDLARFAEADLPRPDLVTASAWLDLVPADWVDRFVERVEAWRVPVLIALSVDGRRGFLDRSGVAIVDDADTRMQQAFNQHQRQPKGVGEQAALGPDACHALAEGLSAAFDVTLAPSDWRLPAGSPEVRSLGIELLAGWTSAAQELASGITLPDIGCWQVDRRRGIERGALGLLVGHQDLLALPR